MRFQSGFFLKKQIKKGGTLSRILTTTTTTSTSTKIMHGDVLSARSVNGATRIVHVGAVDGVQMTGRIVSPRGARRSSVTNERETMG